MIRPLKFCIQAKESFYEREEINYGKETQRMEQQGD